MNFAGITDIAIPEGNVKKIQRGNEVLWEKAPDLPCSPELQIYYSRQYKADPTSSNASNDFTVSIKGIARELVQRFGVTMYFYNAAGTRQYSSTVDAELLDTDNTVNFVPKTVTIASGSNHYYKTFAAFITYTDLDGNTKTLTTSKISSVGSKANASA